MIRKCLDKTTNKTMKTKIIVELKTFYFSIKFTK